MKSNGLLKKADVLTTSLLLVLTFVSWVSPSKEAGGTDFFYQLQWIIFPWILIVYGKYSRRSRKKTVIAFVGYALYFAAIAYVLFNSGNAMNIGNVPIGEILTWLTPVLYFTIAVWILSIILTVIGELRHRKQESN